MDLGTQIRLAREKRGWTVAEFADAAGVTRQAADFWEANTFAPRQKKLAELEELLGVSLSPTGSRARAVNLPKDVEELAAAISRLEKADRAALMVLVRSLAGRQSAPASGSVAPAKRERKRVA